MAVTINEFIKLLAEARLSAERLHNMEIENWLYDNFCFCDEGAMQINQNIKDSYRLTELIDLRLYRSFHGMVVQ